MLFDKKLSLSISDYINETHTCRKICNSLLTATFGHHQTQPRVKRKATRKPKRIWLDNRVALHGIIFKPNWAKVPLAQLLKWWRKKRQHCKTKKRVFTSLGKNACAHSASSWKQRMPSWKCEKVQFMMRGGRWPDEGVMVRISEMTWGVFFLGFLWGKLFKKIKS